MSDDTQFRIDTAVTSIIAKTGVAVMYACESDEQRAAMERLAAEDPRFSVQTVSEFLGRDEESTDGLSVEDKDA